MTSGEKFLLINYLECISDMIQEHEQGLSSKEYFIEHVKDLIKDSKELVK